MMGSECIRNYLRQNDINNDTQRDLGGSFKRWLMIAPPHKSAFHISPALGKDNPIAWRNGSCVASKDCKFDKSISALTYSVGFGFWVNTTCCQGSCQEPTLLGMLPPESSQMGGQGGGWVEERQMGSSLNPHSLVRLP